mmetsp:Transcript_102631/g.288703  ORF Transcript_102631/g.288703 Transcript_102631/m.288703 type:complete len:577 (-) Transcript_102631:4-1734(-)
MHGRHRVACQPACTRAKQGCLGLTVTQIAHVRQSDPATAEQDDDATAAQQAPVAKRFRYEKGPRRVHSQPIHCYGYWKRALIFCTTAAVATEAACSLQEEAIGVEADAHQVDADVAEPDDEEAEGADLGAVAGVPAELEAGVEVVGVDEPADQSPSLLGVPAPVIAPSLVRPDSARDDADGKKAEAEEDRAVGEVVQCECQRLLLRELRRRATSRRELHSDGTTGRRHGDRRSRRLRKALGGEGHGRDGLERHLRRGGIGLLGARSAQAISDASDRRQHGLTKRRDRAVLGLAHGQHSHAQDRAEHEGRIRQHHNGDVHDQPVRLESRHEGGGLLQLLGQLQGGEGHDAKREWRSHDCRNVAHRGVLRAQLGVLLVAVRRGQEEYRHGRHTPSQEHQGLVHVAQREVTALIPAAGKQHRDGGARESERPKGDGLALLAFGLGTAESCTPPGHHCAGQQAAEGATLEDALEHGHVHGALRAMRERVLRTHSRDCRQDGGTQGGPCRRCRPSSPSRALHFGGRGACARRRKEGRLSGQGDGPGEQEGRQRPTAGASAQVPSAIHVDFCHAKKKEGEDG